MTICNKEYVCKSKHAKQGTVRMFKWTFDLRGTVNPRNRLKNETVIKMEMMSSLPFHIFQFVLSIILCKRNFFMESLFKAITAKRKLPSKRFCKTYIKTILKYIQVPPILNFLYGSFSTAWVIHLTARIISTFISISIFPKKIVISCKLNYFRSCHFHNWVR